MDHAGKDSTRGWRRVVALVAMALVAAACGSTVERSAQQTAGPELGDGAGATDNANRGIAADARPSSENVSADRAGPAARRAAGAGEAAIAGGAKQTGAGPASIGAVGRGITNQKITIGIGWFDIAAFAGAFAPGADVSGTTKDAAVAVVRWLNKRGGIAGRQIEPIYHEYPLQDVASNSSRATREQAMCADFTEDHHTFAAIPSIASQGVFYECAAQHNLVTIATSFSEGMVDQTMFERIGHIFYMPHSLLIERREEMFVDQLDRRGFFPPDAKIGVIVEENPQQRRGAERSLFPALKALGVNVVATTYYTPELSTDWTNMVLRFRSAGVTHVVWGASACTFICSGQFMTASESQGYRPFNALGSDHGISGQTLVTPEAQRERIVAVSWTPVDQGYAAYDAAKPINDVDAHCRQAKKESSVDLDQHVFVPYCDGLFFIKRALEAAPTLTADGFRSAVERPEFAHPVINTWSATWGGRHDGASAVRDINYHADCKCFRFSGPTRPIG